MTVKLILFGTAGCHLCEQASEIVGSAAENQWHESVIVDNIDVCDEGYEHWQNLYALKIPVLLHVESGRELCWPFSQEDALSLLKEMNFGD